MNKKIKPIESISISTVHFTLNLPQASRLLGMTILLRHRLLVPLTGAKANSHNKIVIPTGAQPDFLPRGTHQQRRKRLSVEKCA
jgi:hypothetical protein